MKASSGFTLVEIVVTISIIGILTAGTIVGISEAGKRSRDTDRIGDLRALQSALELYRQKNGRYPAGCRGVGVWSGQAGTSYACPSGTQYIVGLAPEFIPTLPRDPKPNGLLSGYVYTTNAAGTTYKLMAKNTVESEVVTYTHEFRSCDATNSGQVACTDATQPKDPVTSAQCDVGMCDRVHGTYSKPSHCEETNTQFQTTYAVWGGYAIGTTETQSARLTEDIICEIP